MADIIFRKSQNGEETFDWVKRARRRNPRVFVRATGGVFSETQAVAITIVGTPIWTDNADGTATVTFTTDVACYAGLNYGTSAGVYTASSFNYDGAGPALELTTTHTVEVPDPLYGGGTEAANTYYYRIFGAVSGDPSGAYIDVERTGDITVGDPLFASVVLLIGNNNLTGTTAPTDQSTKGHNGTFLGNARWHATDNTAAPTGLTTTLNTNWDGVSPDNTSGVSVADHADFDFAGDFTIEGFIATSNTGTKDIICKTNFGADRGWSLVFDAGGFIDFYASSDGSSWGLASAAHLRTGFSANTWYWYAIQRTGNAYKLFSGTIGGTIVEGSGSFTSASAIFSNGQNLIIGNDPANAQAGTQQNHASIRITQASRGYASGQNVPSLPFLT